MTTAYTHRVTIICPESLIPDANQLALVVGESAADDQTFGAASYSDVDGNLYAVSSTVVTDTFQGKATTLLVAPAHAPGADLAAAGRAQAALYIYGVHGTEGVAPDRLWVLIEAAPGYPLAALALGGVMAVESIAPGV